MTVQNTPRFSPSSRTGPKARGSTLYINLEPCSHQGRTGPCADAVIAAGIRRVVASMADPNPQVSGRGFARLRAAGVELATGILEREAKELNEAFAKYIRYGPSLITLKAAMTLDGKIAPPPGKEQTQPEHGAGGNTGGWTTSEPARAHVHELRHANDAIMVGVGTIIADDPLLTDRTGEPRRRPLLRVILDSRLRFPLDSRVVKTARQDLVVFCCFAEENKRRALEARGVMVEQVPMRRPPDDGTILFPSATQVVHGRPDLDRVMSKLGERQITSLIIEGGAMVNWAVVVCRHRGQGFSLLRSQDSCRHRIAFHFASGPGFQRMSDAAYVHSFVLHRFGEDFAVEGYLRDPYGN